MLGFGWVLVGAALVAATVAPGSTPADAAPPPEPQHGQVSAAMAGACGPDEPTRLVEGRVECLHEDEHDQLRQDDHHDHASDGHGAGVAGGAPFGDPEGPDGVPCVGDGTSGHRVRAIYARPADRPDRYDQVVDEIRSHAAEVSEVFRESARQTGGEREVRWYLAGCPDDPEEPGDPEDPGDPDDLDVGTSSGDGGEGDEGVLVVDHVVLPATADDSAVATRAALRALGYSNDLRKYLVWMDSDAICGAGFIFNDDRSDPAINNNARFATMGRVDSGLRADGQLGGPESRCWGFAEAHELGHVLGAVQAPYVQQTPDGPVHHAGTPNATPGFHCTDEWDVMCGDDHGGAVAVPIRYECGDPPEVLDGDRSNERRLDCNHDDYFHTDPPEGSYLAEHWNVADSPFLEGAPALPSPAPVDPPANDDWSDAQVVHGYRTSTAASSAGAGAEDGEPAHGGVHAEHSVWFRWLAPTNGRVRVTTGPVSPAPVSGPLVPSVGVYTGEDLATLVPVANLEGPNGAGRQSAATFTVTPGTTYWIAVDDWDHRGAPFTLRTGPAPNGFVDVGPADADAVDWMTAVDITTGYPQDNTFRPLTQLNRQQMAAFLYRLAGRPPFTPPSTLTFTDVRTTHAFYREIEWLATQGITTGYPDGTFRSNTQLNRQQVAAFLYRTAGATSTSVDEPFTDVSPSHAFRKEITWVWSQGLMDGTTATTFSSNQVMTRASLADALHRLAGSEASWERPPPPTVHFVVGS